MAGSAGGGAGYNIPVSFAIAASSGGPFSAPTYITFGDGSLFGATEQTDTPTTTATATTGEGPTSASSNTAGAGAAANSTAISPLLKYGLIFGGLVAVAGVIIYVHYKS